MVSKAQAAKARSSKLTPATDLIEDFNPSKNASGALVSIAQVSAYTQDIPRSFYVPVEEQSSYYFFHHFFRKDLNSPIAYNDYIPKIYNLTSSYSELPAIIQAIGMAGIANLQSSSEPMMIARRKHTACLRALNSSLQDPKTATSDATFMTVLLLSLYEVRFLPYGHFLV